MNKTTYFRNYSFGSTVCSHLKSHRSSQTELMAVSSVGFTVALGFFEDCYTALNGIVIQSEAQNKIHRQSGFGLKVS